MLSFNKSTDQVKIIVTLKDKEIQSEILEITRDGKEYFRGLFRLVKPNLKDISEDSFQKFFSSAS